MSPTPKHLRPRYRYLAVILTSWPTADITNRSFQRELWHASRSLLGDVGSATTDLTVIRFSFIDGSGEAIVRTTREHVHPARAALACVSHIDTEPVGIFVKGISGTVRACEEKYLGQRPKSINEQHVAFKDAAHTAFIRGDRADIRMNNAFMGATDLDFD